MGILHRLLTNRTQILEGFKNNLLRREDVEQVARERLAVCQQCSSFDTEGSACYVPGTQPCCAECGCCLAMKTRSLAAACPLGKWPALLTEQEADSLPTDLQL